MTPQLSCPSCGGTDLVGTPDGSEIRLACGDCEHTWTRDPSPRCRICGSERVVYAPKPLWERGRGEQRTPAGRIDSYRCADCGGTDVTSANPRPG